MDTIEIKKSCMLCNSMYHDGSHYKCVLVKNPESYLTTPHTTVCKHFKLADEWKISPNKDFIKMLEKYDDTVIFPMQPKSITAATPTHNAIVKINIPTNIIGADVRDMRKWTLYIVAFRNTDKQEQ